MDELEVGLSSSENERDELLEVKFETASEVDTSFKQKERHFGDPKVKLEFVDCGYGEEVPEDYKCLLCSLSFSHNDLLIDHYKCCPERANESTKTDTNCVNVYVCAFCTKVIADETVYHEHVDLCKGREHPKEVRVCNRKFRNQFKCDKCDFIARWKHRLVEHSVVHDDQRRVQCDECEKCFKTKGGLRYHVKTRHSKATTKFQCLYCDNSYMLKRLLVAHLNAKHLNERRYKCDVCGFAANTKSILRGHIQAKHGQREKPHKCTYCAYSTHTKVHLVAHMCTHTKEKPFKCLRCEFKSSEKSNLIRHSRKMHS